MTNPSTYAALAGLLVALFIYFRKLKASAASLPPGPLRYPLLGNIANLTAKELWLPATRWAKQFGDVVHLDVFGAVHLIFLNSPESTMDLLDKRGSIYSDKPQFLMTGELCGCKNMVAFTGNNDQSKRQRKLMHKAFAQTCIPAYYPLIENETYEYLRKLISEPADYMKHIRRYAGSLTLSVVYGYQVLSNNDPYLGLAEECVDILANEIASGGGIWPVDIFPSLQHLPTWFPGAGFKLKAARWKAKMEEWVDKPYEFLKNGMKTGQYKHSFCSMLLEDEDGAKPSPEFEFDLKWTANSMYGASMDTSIATISHFFLAIIQHPEVLAKAQREIDAVVGSDRLPTFEDRDSLPYIEAVLQETWRWGVPLPLSLPHRLMEDDVYRGMHIPKGSLIFGNIWAIMHDEEIYPDSYTFNPDRFLTKVDADTERKRNPRNYVFGFGRRLCPGRHLVDSSLWLLIACMIATLDISKAVDDQGNTIEPEVQFENPIFRSPSKFPCDFRPRSEKALALIKQCELPTSL
ncbi:hypothetical protein K443DRAFT_678273 [Laccaria amethystina LaAM-08-1]|uniref:Cytochrome P450 n=1 Tax=Laccaria amethystina LaAM-08-1 TaxID=1095629 RepID=A0A0C9XVG3_9AGAR|nr:hypothetical protein K443DRAFT_678273 [Laccaria amethystina LaAM-08-1]